MRLKYFAILAVCFFLVGCTTTKQPSEVSQLQIKVSQLERKLDEKDQEISDLKYDISEMSSRLESSAPAGTDAQSESQSKTSSVTKIATDEILRVSASAKDVQRALKKAGYYDGNVDGKLGAMSQKAISSFQSDHNLASDGVIGQKTWNELKKYLE